MAEYIDRETLMRDIDETVIFSGRDGRISAEIRGANKVIDRIKICAVADVAPVVHGKWIFDHMTGERSYYANCSNCGKQKFFKDYAEQDNYCSKCGANMDLEDE